MTVSAIVSKETLANADAAIFGWFSELRVDYGQTFGQEYGLSPCPDLRNHPVFRYVTIPERTIADALIYLKAQGFFHSSVLNNIDDRVREEQRIRTFPFPYIAITQQAVNTDTDRHMVPGRLTAKFSDGLTWNQYRWPSPWVVDYMIDFYALTDATRRYMSEWLLGQFTPLGSGINRRFIPMQHPAPWGVLQAELEMVQHFNNTITEVAGAKERVSRWTTMLRLKVWDVDLTPVATTRAIVRGRISVTRKDSEAAPELGDYGPELLAIDEDPMLMYKAAPVPPQHTKPFTTATVQALAETDIYAYKFADNVQIVETCSLPFLDGDIVQCMTEMRWRSVDGSTPSSVIAEVIWRSGTTAVVAQRVTLPYSREGVTHKFVTSPQAEVREVALRLRLTTSKPTLLCLDGMAISRQEITNLVDVGDRSVTGLTTSTLVSLTGLLPGKAYVASAYVTYAAQSVTLSLYRDSGFTDLVHTQIFSASGEFSAIGTPSSAGTLYLRVTLGTPDPAASISRILIGRSGPRIDLQL